MEQEPDNVIGENAQVPAKPVIPPPGLAKPPPPPPSPLESLPKPTPPPSQEVPVENTAARVNLRGSRVEADVESSANRPVLFNTRISAAIIDLLVAVGVNIGLVLILPGFAARLGWVVGIAYLLARDSLPFLGGQSVGKKAMGIRAVTTLDGKPLTGNWEAGLIRNGVLIIPLFPLIELFILLSREDKPERGLRLGDEWAKTRVIIEPKPPVPEEVG
jgi:uncharacterized RDD family membrane protein YckC